MNDVDITVFVPVHFKVGASMPCLGDVTEEEEGVPASSEGGEGEGAVGQDESEEAAEGSTGEEIGKRKRQPSQKMIEAMGMLKRKIPETPTQGKVLYVNRNI